jgi:hypothetical protein
LRESPDVMGTFKNVKCRLEFGVISPEIEIGSIICKAEVFVVVVLEQDAMQ